MGLATTVSLQGASSLASIMLLLIISLLSIYVVRHYFFTLNRLFGRQRHPYIDIETANWPRITVVIPAHNEEMVIAQAIEALLEVDYPSDRLLIIPVNDRSTDQTASIIDEYASRYPLRIRPLHRQGGTPGKGAALLDATLPAQGDLLLVFDADYIPGRGLIKQLVSPFFDPEIGAVMGRVVPLNVGSNLLTRLLDLERAAGYQVDQQARMNLFLVPQYGGTVGGVRLAALREIGGWREDVLAEDTDLTIRLLLNGWKTVYQNRSECYEQVPESWPVRIRQIARWAKGHNQVFARYFLPLLKCRRLSPGERLDGALLLGVYLLSPLILLGWGLSVFLYFAGALPFSSAVLALFAMVSFSTIGNFAAFYQIAAATYLDGSGARVRLMPLVLLGFLVSLVATSVATFEVFVLQRFSRRALVWHKTERYRTDT